LQRQRDERASVPGEMVRPQVLGDDHHRHNRSGDRCQLLAASGATRDRNGKHGGNRRSQLPQSCGLGVHAHHDRLPLAVFEVLAGQ
jgi:hypothetical protein